MFDDKKERKYDKKITQNVLKKGSRILLQYERIV